MTFFYSFFFFFFRVEVGLLLLLMYFLILKLLSFYSFMNLCNEERTVLQVLHQIVILKKDALLNKIDHKHISRDADVVNNGCF